MTLILFLRIGLVIYLLSVGALAFHTWRGYQLTRKHCSLPPPPNARTWPTLDVLIPVKDEEHNIGACIESVLRQGYPNIRIIVVNDRSTDGTVAAVEAIQARHPEVSRFDVKELPAGFYGKPHALSNVLDQLRGDYVAFVDSDMQLSPTCLRTLVHQVDTHQVDCLAAVGAPDLRFFWERLLVPAFGAVIFAWYDPRKINDPNWPNAMGSGLMVVRRTAYEAIGGHRAVIRIYDEDSELVRIAKRAGQKISFVLTPDLFNQRHYTTLARTFRGITRTFIGGIKTIPRLIWTICGIGFVCALPFLVPAMVWIGAERGWPIHETLPFWLSGAAIHLITSTGLSLTLYGSAGALRRYAPLFPLAGAVLTAVCIRAIAHLWRHEAIAWRGTSYPEKTQTG